MKRMVAILVAAVACAISCGAIAATAKKCSVTGDWTDKFGAEATFRTNKVGVATDTSLCAKPYRLAVTGLTSKKFDIDAASARKSCPTFTASLTFQGGCTTATGIVVVTGKGSYHDAWTKQGAAVRHEPNVSATLNDGLK